MVMTVNEGQTAAMQQVLMRFWEELARQKDWLFDEAKKSFSAEQESPEPPNIKMQVYRQGQLIYGAQDGPPIESIDPRFVGQLEVLQSLGVGTQVATAAGIRVEALVKQGGQEVTRQTLFQTDETGTVKINILSPPIERKTGLDVVREHLSALKEESVREESLYLKSLLLEIKQLYSAQEKMFGLIDQQQQDLKELRQQRLLQPHQPNWWQRLGNRWKSFDESFKRAHQEREGAKALLALFRREVEPDGKLFEGMEYAIARDGSRYSFRERQGTELMRFEVNQSGGIVVESSQLQPRQLEELAQLRENLRSVSDLPASFASLEQVATSRHLRSSQIAAQLVQLARKEGTAIRKKGQKYDLELSPDGSVQIWSKDSQSRIYVRGRSGNNVFVLNKMTEPDLSFFETQLKNLQQRSDIERANRQIKQPEVARKITR